MVSGLQRRRALRRKLHILRTLTCSKSVKKSCIIADSILYICKLKLQLEKIRRELSNFDASKTKYFNLMKQLQFQKKEVKVEKAGEGFKVRVKCEKEGDNLVGILEVFEGMGLMVLNASVSTNFYFHMEAIVVPELHDIKNCLLDANIVAQAILQAIEKQPCN